MLAVQRVNKGFNARERCGTRTYHYFLPAAMLDMKCDGEGFVGTLWSIYSHCKCCGPCEYHYFLPAPVLDMRCGGEVFKKVSLGNFSHCKCGTCACLHHLLAATLETMCDAEVLAHWFC